MGDWQMTEAQTLSLISNWQPHFSGPLLAPSHEGYWAARQLWNGMIDRQPALIARCTSPQDVISAIKLARAEGLHVSVRGGGHGVAGTAVCQDGLMIDLAPMKKIAVDPARRQAVAEPGVLWGEFDRTEFRGRISGTDEVTTVQHIRGYYVRPLNAQSRLTHKFRENPFPAHTCAFKQTKRNLQR